MDAHKRLVEIVNKYKLEGTRLFNMLEVIPGMIRDGQDRIDLVKGAPSDKQSEVWLKAHKSLQYIQQCVYKYYTSTVSVAKLTDDMSTHFDTDTQLRLASPDINPDSSSVLAPVVLVDMDVGWLIRAWWHIKWERAQPETIFIMLFLAIIEDKRSATMAMLRILRHPNPAKDWALMVETTAKLLFCYSCTADDEWLLHTIIKSRILESAMTASQLHLLIEHMFICCCIAGDAPVAKKLYQRYGAKYIDVRADNDLLIRVVVVMNHLSVVRLLVQLSGGAYSLPNFSTIGNLEMDGRTFEYMTFEYGQEDADRTNPDRTVNIQIDHQSLMKKVLVPENIEETEMCCVCYDRKVNVKMNCQHELCQECFHKWYELYRFEEAIMKPKQCTYCRADLDWKRCTLYL